MLYKYLAYKKDSNIPEFVVYAHHSDDAKEKLEDWMVDGNINDWTLRLSEQSGGVYYF